MHSTSDFLLQNSFADIARVLSEFFRDLDVVPTDVVAGLVLLRKRQQLIRFRVVQQVSPQRQGCYVLKNPKKLQNNFEKVECECIFIYNPQGSTFVPKWVWHSLATLLCGEEVVWSDRNRC